MSWSNEETMAFLEAYQSESCIWNPKDIYHKDMKKVADAWSRISQELKKPVKELKAKKEILMTTFRKHFKKKQDSICSGAGTEDIYKPSWFAFEFMESFLVPVYNCKYTLNTETSSQRDIDEIGNEPGDGEMNNDTTLQDNETPNTSLRTPTFTQKSRRRPAPDLAEQQMAAAFGQLTNVLGRKSERPPQPEEDECDLYGKLLAKKLRELPKNERQMIMYQIDGIFINRLQLNRETPSPQYSYTRYSSNSNVHRPASTQSSYSEPYTIVHRPPSTQSSYSEPYTSVTAPKRPFPTENFLSVPLHAKVVPKYRRTSSVLPPPPQYAQEIDDNISYAIIHRPPENDDNTITLHSDQPNSANLQNSKISITSEILHYLKYYTLQSYDLARVKLHRMHLVLFTKSAYPDKHFQSPTSEYGGPTVFPQLTDADMRLKRCPGLLPGSGREIAIKNAMVEYIHSTAMSDKVLGLELRDEMKTMILFENIKKEPGFSSFWCRHEVFIILFKDARCTFALVFCP